MAETQDGQGVWAVPSGPQTLEREGIPDCGVALREDSFPAGGCGDGRLPFRLGCSMAVQDCQRPVGCPAETGAYKCAGTPCSVLSSQALPSSSEGPTCSCPDRQHLHSLPRQPSGGHQIEAEPAGHAKAPSVGVPPFSKPEGCPCSRCPEHSGRPSLSPRATPRRVETPSGGGGDDLGQVWQGSGGSLCFRRDHPLSPLVLLDGEDQSPRAGRSGSCLARQPALCISPNSPFTGNAGQGPAWLSQPTSGGSTLARKAMVRTIIETPQRRALVPPRETGPSVSGRRTHMAHESRAPAAVRVAPESQDPLQIGRAHV